MELNSYLLSITLSLLFISGMECAPLKDQLKPVNATRKIIPPKTSNISQVPATAQKNTSAPLDLPQVNLTPLNFSSVLKLDNGGHNLSENSSESIHQDHLANDTLSSKKPTIHSVMGFLQKYGYLEGHTTNSEALYREEAVVGAITTMQSFGGISPTGIIDNATIQLLMTPRCGNKDVESNSEGRKKRFVIGAPGWSKRRLTFFLANWTPKLGSEDATLSELQKAFKVWSDYAHLKFVQVPTPDADIVVLFGHGYHGDRYPFDGQGFTLAHAYYPYEFGTFGGDVHFDEDEPWIIGSIADDSTGSNGIDFFTVATHELGHSLGLSHSPIPGSIMFPYYKGFQPNLQLDYDDILAMYQLYISRPIVDNRIADEENNETSTLASTTSTTTSTRPTTPYSTIRTTGRSNPTRRIFDDEDDDFGSGDQSVDDDDQRKTKKDEINPRGSNETSTRTKEEEDGIKNDPVKNDGLKPGVKNGIPNTRDDEERKKNVTINYEGDYETVDEHLRKLNLTTDDHSDRLPNICDGYFDAVSALRNELFVFKDKYVWRLRQRSYVDYGYPTHIRNLFRELPSTLRKVDALYERPDGNIVFFSGPRYWVFNGDFMVEENSPLSYLGLPHGLEKLDAAFIWGKNKKTYFFSKNLYWRYDDSKREMDPGYPHDLSRWRGVPTDIDAAMQWTDGKTYFFKNKYYWGFDDAIVRTEIRYPLRAPSHWLGCPE